MIEKKAFKCKTLVLCIQAQNAKKMALTVFLFPDIYKYRIHLIIYSGNDRSYGCLFAKSCG